MKRCKICRVEAELDDQGRCGGCAASQKALDSGMSYGRYMAMLEAQGKSKIRARRVEIIMATCPWCGMDFPKTGKRVYCSDNCRRQADKAKNRIRPGTLPIKTCPLCGREFRPEKRDTIYCSRACARKGREIERHDRSRVD